MMPSHPYLPCFRVFLASFCLGCLWAEAAPIDFNRDVRPILSDQCFFCHGPDAADRKADLRLDEREAALDVLSPGKPEESMLLERVHTSDAEDLMPPPATKRELTTDQKAILRQWIAEGAPYDEHWAYRSLEAIPIPKVDDASRVRNPIDAFVQRRLEEREWTLSAEAERERLIRRVTFDLTGLPPTPQEIDTFLADTSSDAYEDLVDRLLRSKRYGERMAAEWMDVARYSDSYGYQVDRDRRVWPWRDWVIQAFNDNLPYDDFITWQLAGDLLPNASREQRLATTFNRLHSQKVEGGSVPEEFRVEYVADRTHTFGTAFLGLTLECSRCHDHKYDPISQKEYYQLFAFFANIDEAGLYSYFTDSVPTPTMELTTPAQEKALSDLTARVRATEVRLASSSPEQIAPLSGEVARHTFDQREGGTFVNAVDDQTPASSNNANTLVPGKEGQAIRLSGDDPVNLKVGNFKRSQPFTVSWWMQTPDVKERAVVWHRSRAWTDAASRGYEVLLDQGRLRWSLIHFWPGNAISVRTVHAIPVNEWVHVSVSHDGSSRADGLRIYLNGREAPVEIYRDHLTRQIKGGGGDTIAIGERFRDRGFTGGLIDTMRVFDRALHPDEIAHLGRGIPLPKAIPVLAEAPLRDLREKRDTLLDQTEEIMIMRETPTPRESYLLSRGAYDARAEPVTATTPAFLPPMDASAPRNRLGLARWLTDPAHPLTARVTVNRYWQLFFGKGLVGTPEDFGSQGSLPTHPELLDWLAYQLIQDGWDLKALVKRMVLSQTYRQRSQATEAHQAKDPENVWLARARRYRLSAEMIRDNALYASGLLVEHIGGPPVKPYEVAASFKPVDHEKGDGLYRRSLYTYWKRTSPAPVMIALNAPKRDVCKVERAMTATPLQAFVYMNDPQAIEAARTLAARLLDAHGDSNATLMDDLFRWMTSRHPRPEEQRILKQMLEEQLSHFRDRPKDAQQYLQTGEAPLPEHLEPTQLAAVTVVANSLLAFDDCVMKR